MWSQKCVTLYIAASAPLVGKFRLKYEECFGWRLTQGDVLNGEPVEVETNITVTFNIEG